MATVVFRHDDNNRMLLFILFGFFQFESLHTVSEFLILYIMQYKKKRALRKNNFGMYLFNATFLYSSF